MLYINGDQVDSISDSSYGSGVIGLFAASGELDSGVNVIFDDVVISKLAD
jgi:hypothetical protein